MHHRRYLWTFALIGALGLILTGCPETVSGCEPGFEMQEGFCVPIGMDAQIPDTGVDSGTPCGVCPAEMPICDLTADPPTCIQCEGDQNCTEGTATMCNTATNTCVECMMDDQCTSPDNAACNARECRHDPIWILTTYSLFVGFLRPQL